MSAKGGGPPRSTAAVSRWIGASMAVVLPVLLASDAASPVMGPVFDACGPLLTRAGLRTFSLLTVTSHCCSSALAAYVAHTNGLSVGWWATQTFVCGIESLKLLLPHAKSPVTLQKYILCSFSVAALTIAVTFTHPGLVQW